VACAGPGLWRRPGGAREVHACKGSRAPATPVIGRDPTTGFVGFYGRWGRRPDRDCATMTACPAGPHAGLTGHEALAAWPGRARRRAKLPPHSLAAGPSAAIGPS
jgi:hypothetical protein